MCECVRSCPFAKIMGVCSQYRVLGGSVLQGIPVCCSVLQCVVQKVRLLCGNTKLLLRI